MKSISICFKQKYISPLLLLAIHSIFFAHPTRHSICGIKIPFFLCPAAAAAASFSYQVFSHPRRRTFEPITDRPPEEVHPPHSFGPPTHDDVLLSSPSASTACSPLWSVCVFRKWVLLWKLAKLKFHLITGTDTRPLSNGFVSFSSCWRSFLWNIKEQKVNNQNTLRDNIVLFFFLLLLLDTLLPLLLIAVLLLSL